MPPRVIFRLLFAAVALIGISFFSFDDEEQDIETICKLFNVRQENISAPSVRIINKLTGHEPSNWELPYQDADYRIEGCFRLPVQALSQVKGTPLAPADDYHQYTGETITDWLRDDAFKTSLLKRQVDGDVLFSPRTGWVYFNLD